MHEERVYLSKAYKAEIGHLTNMNYLKKKSLILDVIVEQENEDGDDGLLDEMQSSIFSANYFGDAYQMQHTKAAGRVHHISKHAMRRRDICRTCMQLRAKANEVEQAQQDLHRQHHNDQLVDSVLSFLEFEWRTQHNLQS